MSPDPTPRAFILNCSSGLNAFLNGLASLAGRVFPGVDSRGAHPPWLLTSGFFGGGNRNAGCWIGFLVSIGTRRLGPAQGELLADPIVWRDVLVASCGGLGGRSKSDPDEPVDDLDWTETGRAAGARMRDASAE